MGQLIPNKNILSKYFYYCLITDSYKNFIKNLSDGTNINNLKFKDLQIFKIPIPPLAEQKRIVAILDKTFTTIDKIKNNTEKNLANTKELWQSYLQQSFNNPKKNWQQKKLGDVCELKYGKALNKIHRTKKGKYPVYGANGIKTYSDQYVCNKQGIIVGRKGSAGAINLAQSKFWPLDVSYYIEFDEKKYNLLFLYYLLLVLNLPTLAKGVKPGLNRNEVYSIVVFIPPLAEQKQITERLDYLSQKTTALQETYCKKIQNLIELKNSILKQAFQGEL